MTVQLAIIAELRAHAAGLHPMSRAELLIRHGGSWPSASVRRRHTARR